MVKGIYHDEKKLFGYYESLQKINLKSVKFFKNPIVFNTIKEKLSINNYTKKEIIKISKEELKTILSVENIVSDKPLYMSDLNINYEDLMISIIKISFETLNKNKNLKQMSINEFITIIHDNVQLFKLKISLEEIREWYSRNIWKLNFRHIPSRYSEKNSVLYDKLGKPKNFGYLLFEEKGK